MRRFIERRANMIGHTALCVAGFVVYTVVSHV